MERRKLSEDETATELAKLPGWEFDDDAIKKSWKFENFAQALEFVNKVGTIAEAADHHPDIKLGWGYVKIKTTTHDRNAVTHQDLALAAKIDEI